MSAQTLPVTLQIQPPKPTENIIAIIQARMSSSRLPGKVLAPIAGRPMLDWVVTRTSRAACLTQVVTATTIQAADDPIADWCKTHEVPCLRGNPHDVLDRYYQTSRRFEAEVIVRITADCPLIDPAIIDQTVGSLFESEHSSDQYSVGGKELNTEYCPPKIDFVANRLPPPWGRTTPIGLDVEAFTFTALERAWQEANEPHQREHVTPFFYEDIPPQLLQPSPPLSPTSDHWQVRHTTSPRGFRVALLHHHPDYGHHRWTVDTPEDLTLVRAVVSRLPNDTFTWQEVLALFEREPELAQINARVPHKTARDVDERF